MHHFGEDSINVIPVGPDYDVIFKNKATGREVRMRIPGLGAFDDPTREITPSEVENLGRVIAHTLRQHLV